MGRLNRRYFDWIVSLVGMDRPYRKLLELLDDTDFEYKIARDGNRYEDGVDLRYRFGYENGIPQSELSEIDNRPCSVLEMMAALTLRCEEDIMDDPDHGNRSGVWFWGMIDNLGLSEYTDDNFDAIAASRIIVRFLKRGYEKNGKGGLFTVYRKAVDMRKEEIWYQAMWYLDEYLARQKGV